MPFAFDPLDEEQKKKAEEEAAGASAPAMTGGGETFGSEGPSVPKQQSEQTQKGVSRQGSGFVGLDKYMAANRGNNFGGQFTSKTQDTLSKANQAQEQGAQQFQTASNQGTTRWNDIGDTVKSTVDNAGDNTSKDDIAKFQGYSNAQYQGPQSYLGTQWGSQAMGATQKAAQESKALQSEGGRFALLDQYYGRPKYSMGEKALDNLLVQNTPGVAARTQALGNQGKQVSSQFNKSASEMDNLATANRQATIDASRQTQDYLNQKRSGLTSDLEKRYGDYKTAAETWSGARRADVADDALDSDTLSMLGLNEGDSLYDLNLSNYIQDSPVGTMGQFATDQDYAKYLALQQLAGEDASLLRAEDRARAGTAGSGKVTGNIDALKRDLSDRKSAYDTTLRSYIDQHKATRDAQSWLDAYDANPELNGTGMAYRSPEQIQQLRDFISKETASYRGQLDNQFGVNRKASRA